MKSTNLLRACVVLAVAVFAVATVDSANARLFDRLRGNDCCCQPTSCCEATPCCEAQPACPCEAPVVQECACEATPCCETQCCETQCCERGGFLKGLLNRGNDCCCEEAACGCEAAPACPCEHAAPAVVEDCGCAEATPCCQEETACCDSGFELGGELKCRLGGMQSRLGGFRNRGCGC